MLPCYITLSFIVGSIRQSSSTIIESKLSKKKKWKKNVGINKTTTSYPLNGRYDYIDRELTHDSYNFRLIIAFAIVVLLHLRVNLQVVKVEQK